MVDDLCDTHLTNIRSMDGPKDATQSTESALPATNRALPFSDSCPELDELAKLWIRECVDFVTGFEALPAALDLPHVLRNICRRYDGKAELGEVFARVASAFRDYYAVIENAREPASFPLELIVACSHALRENAAKQLAERLMATATTAGSQSPAVPPKEAAEASEVPSADVNRSQVTGHGQDQLILAQLLLNLQRNSDSKAEEKKKALGPLVAELLTSAGALGFKL